MLCSGEGRVGTTLPQVPYSSPPSEPHPVALQAQVHLLHGCGLGRGCSPRYPRPVQHLLSLWCEAPRSQLPDASRTSPCQMLERSHTVVEGSEKSPNPLLKSSRVTRRRQGLQG